MMMMFLGPTVRIVTAFSPLLPWSQGFSPIPPTFTLECRLGVKRQTGDGPCRIFDLSTAERNPDFHTMWSYVVVLRLN
ncbi:hypothetical protein N7461_007479 [Penicillium sp. DV-2018c]|nr:hypothetical protein N7461_007479 [Penicillium sp. DV-2018c]